MADLYENYTYEDYCTDLDNLIRLDEGITNLISIPSFIKELISIVKNELNSIIADTKIGMKEIVASFRNRTIYDILKAFGFSFKLLFTTCNRSIALIDKGLLHIFKELHKTGIAKKIVSGSVKIDDVLNKHPILKKVTGPIIMGILVLVWLNMTFTGHIDYDLDVSSWFSALKGNFSIYDLFASPQGMTMLAFLATGMASGGMLSVTYAASTIHNFALAFSYVALKKAKANPAVLNNIKNKIHLKKEEVAPNRLSFNQFLITSYK